MIQDNSLPYNNLPVDIGDLRVNFLGAEDFLNLQSFWLSKCLVLYPFVYVHFLSITT